LIDQNSAHHFLAEGGTGTTKFSLANSILAPIANSMNRHRVFQPLLTLAAVFLAAAVAAHAQQEGPKHISDNSFLIEEAYNQEPGVVQHIFNWFPTWDHSDGELREFQFLYTIELPVGSQTHQFSFTPMNFEHFADEPDAGPREEEGGWGDTLLNYRYQLTTDEECSMVPAIAPRFSLILPTGDEDRGLGTGEVGYQFNLPVSKELDPFAFHFNAGATFTPNASVDLGGGADSPYRDLKGYNLGGSIIWLATYDFNVMLELVSFWDEELDDAGSVRDTNTVLLNPGVRGALFTGDEVQWVAGVGVPVGLSEDAPDIGLFIYMSVEHNFRKMD
jgi:hypothetical protein